MLGPEGIRQRMSEIQQRMREAFPDRSSEATSPGAPRKLEGSFGLDAFRPFDPKAAGIKWNPDAETLRPLIEEAANRNGVAPELLDALVSAESAYDSRARSRAGALGLTQLMPGTAEALGVSDPFDPAQNLNGGAKYLSQLIQRFDGDLPKALAAYNAGPNAVLKHGGIPPYTETQNYVNRVLSIYQQRRQQP